MSIGRICTRVVATATPNESGRAAAQRMAEHNVGTVVVLDEDHRPLGILTDRDLVVRLLANGQDPETTTVAQVMTKPVRTLHEATPIEEALGTMAGAGIRRIVVTGDEGALAGIVTLDDMVELLAGEAGRIGEVIRKESPRFLSPV
jgi:CBS domain-containing protein